ncbi:uncharacterized protein OCT59_010096 [Rhizophagus irregularis]|uniref:uncharacterized protein n=1 Tax=Rhizophagus irregularis TaxID=588596 RepID=UPI0019E0A248|nr:hypothetical protein OCT59_010096 [Rhizophagus irregularis]GET54463.1 hypothetical protein GLOIN_2v1633430 [Rhizophagus irregularis DAOM 181602=DAOM 197198]
MKGLLSSANRKNRGQQVNTQARKLTGRKIDGIIYSVKRLLEFDFNDQRAKKFKPLALYISGYGSNSQGYGVLVDQFAFFDINLSAQDYHKGQPTNFKYSEH